MNVLNKLNILIGDKFNINKIKNCFGKYSNNVIIKKKATLDDIYVYSVYLNNLYSDFYYIYIHNDIIINIDMKESYC